MNKANSRKRVSLLLGESLRMTVLSLASFATGYLITVAFTEVVHLDAEISYSIAVVTCTVLNFFGFRHFVFVGKRQSIQREAVKYFPSALLFRLGEIGLFSLLMRMSVNYHISYVATAFVAISAKFAFLKLLVFERR